MFRGIIIEESLHDTSVLKQFPIVETEVEQVTPNFGTPWLKQWTLHTIEVPEDQIADFSQAVQSALDSSRSNWYVDFKNDATHYIIFKNRIFVIDRTKKEQYQEATDYGISLGIPAHQVNFSQHVVG